MDLEGKEIKDLTEFETVNPAGTQYMITDQGKFTIAAFWTATIAYINGLIETIVAAANAAKDAAQEWADAAESSADNAADSAGIALAAAQPPRVILSEATASHALEPNKFYDLVLTGSALSLYTFSQPPNPDSTKLQQIVLHITVGSVAPTIDWGVFNFLRDKVPSISAGKAYEVIFEYHPPIATWVLSYVSFTPTY